MRGHRGNLRHIISFVLVILILLGSTSTMAYAKDSSDSPKKKAINYIISSQKKDGSFTDNVAMNILYTSEILKVLDDENLNEVKLAKEWLEKQEVNNLDFISRIISYVSDTKKATFMQQIIMAQNEDGGFGVIENYGSDLLDTALVVQALLDNKESEEIILKATDYLYSKQNIDGSWSEYNNDEGSIFLTSYIKNILNKVQNDYGRDYSNNINKSKDWLIAKKNSLNDINSDNLTDYIYVYFGLYEENYDEVEDIVNKVADLQKSNGSINESVYETALVVELLNIDEKVNTAKIEEIKLYNDGTEVSEIEGNKILQIKTKYYGRNCSMEVKVYDSNKNEYDTYQKQNDSNFYWNTELITCGDYSVQAILKDKDGNEVDKIEKPIKVLPYLKVTSSSIITNPYVSIRGNSVSPTVTLSMESRSNTDGMCTVNTSLLDNNDKVVFYNSIEKKIVNGVNTFDTATFKVDDTMSGIYKVVVTVNYEGNELLSVSTYYRIIEKSKSLYTVNSDFDKGIMNSVSYDEVADQLQLTKQVKDFYSMFFTLQDIVIFGYEDGTHIKVCDQYNNIKWEGDLGKGEQKVLKVSRGIYKTYGNNKFSILTGDPISNSVSGYYAMNEEGYGCGTDLYTWVPNIYDSCKFIVFAMEDDTEVKVIENESEKEIWSGKLNKGEHWESKSISSKYIHITANKKVSALTDYDQSYYVPSVNGNWSGKEFYTHVGNTGNWTHELTVASYADNNVVTIKDTTTGEEIWSGTLNYGEYYVVSYPNGADKYITINSSNTVTACVQPWYKKSSSYHQGVYVMDKDGVGLGQEFIATSLSDGNLYVLSYKDDTKVDIYNSKTGEFIKSYNMNSGEYLDVNPGNGIWLIKSNKTISIYSGYGTASAGFTPVEFGGLVMAKEGNWNVINEGDSDDYFWSKIAWTEEKTEGTNIIVKARVANSIEELKDKEYIEVINGVTNESLKGKFIQVQVDFTSSTTVSPILKDIFIGNEEEYKSTLVADAGDDQYFNVTSNDGVLVKLDGSKSYDSNGKKLTYKWTWDGGKAEGVSPIVKLNEGVTEITLVVNNGVNDSEPDVVKINVSKEKITSSIASDKLQYKSLEDVSLTVTAKNPINSNLSLVGEIQIIDEDGNLVEVVAKDISCELKGEEEKSFNNIWNTKTYITGKYVAKVIWYENNKEVSSSCTDFNIISDKGVTNTIKANKVEYMQDEIAILTQNIKNESDNNIEKELDVKLLITDENGNIVFSKDNNIQELLYSSNLNIVESFNILDNTPGEYTATSYVYDKEGTLLSVSNTTFKVLATKVPEKAIIGEITLDKNKVTNKEEVNISYKLSNVGNVDINNCDYSINLYDKDNQKVQEIFNNKEDISLGESITDKTKTIFSNLENGYYYCVLQINNDEEEDIILDWEMVTIINEVVVPDDPEEPDNPEAPGNPDTPDIPENPTNPNIPDSNSESKKTNNTKTGDKNNLSINVIMMMLGLGGILLLKREGGKVKNYVEK